MKVFISMILLLSSSYSFSQGMENLSVEEFSSFNIFAYYGREEAKGLKVIALKLPKETKYGGLNFVALKYKKEGNVILSSEIYAYSDSIDNPKEKLLFVTVKDGHQSLISFQVLFGNTLFFLNGFEKL